jgi:hypothetical protein
MRLRLAFASVLFALTPWALFAEASPQHERVAASFLLALGRVPAPDEAAHWLQLGEQPIAWLIARHRERLQNDPAGQRAVATKAQQDAFGRLDEHELASSAVSPATYTELMQRHLRRLAEQPADYDRVIRRAYQWVVRREAYDPELAYWKKHDTLSYAMLVGCIDDWARRNQPGLMVTAGIATVSMNCEFLATVKLSPAIAQEARKAAGLAAPGEEELALAFGRNLVAPGGAGIVTGGRVAFAAVGR